MVTNQGGGGGMAAMAMHFMFAICIHANDKPDSFTVTNERVHGGDTLYVQHIFLC